MAFRNLLNRVPGISLPEDDQPILPTAGTPNPEPPAASGGGAFSFIRNPFSSSGSVSLGSDEAPAPGTDPSDNLLNLSYFERVSLFAVTLIGSAACFIICITLFPLLSLKPKKFAIIWSLGSILFLVSFCFLNGFIKFFNHLRSKDRLWFSVAYIGSIIVTLMFSVVYRSALLVIPACAIQLICAIWYTVSYFPYGRQGLSLTSNVARSQVEGWINS